MPEIKNNFVQAKMNKDLDRRLVPNGQYRHAVNIQISNSDGSEVGSIENVAGNNLVYSYGESYNIGSRCVGAIADESKDVIYWFVSSPESGNIQYNIDGNEDSGIKGWSCMDCITNPSYPNAYTWTDKITQHSSSPIPKNTPVFVDNYLIKTWFEHGSNDVDGRKLNISGTGVFGETGNKYYYVVKGGPSLDITPGMTCYFFNEQSHAGVLSGSENVNDFSGQINSLYPYPSGAVVRKVIDVDIDNANNLCVLFDKDLIYEHDAANFTPSAAPIGSSIQQYNYLIFDKKRLLNFNCGNIVTGINTLYDFLLWTDNDSEPKKIHVPRSIDGTISSLKNTRLIVQERGIDSSKKILVKEENISVIKKYPKNKPLVEEKIEYALTATTEYNFVTEFDGVVSIMNIAGGNITVTFDNFTGGNNFIVGEEIRFLEVGSTQTLPNDFKVRCKVLENVSNITTTSGPGLLGQGWTFTQPANTYKLEILSISPNTTINTTQGTSSNTVILQNWNVERVLDTKSLFEKNFARFGYRWRYQDGEYSTFSPFSDIVFEPGKFNYDSKKAYNTAMQNQLVRLTLRNIIAKDMPDDVVQVDILYVDANSSNVYVVDKLRYNDYGHVSIGSQTYNHWQSNQYEIKSDIIYAVVPENQSFRSWDNVPRKALAQEVTGNRIVYANYLQNYTLKDNVEGLYEKPVLEVALDNRWNSKVVYSTDRGVVTATTSKVLYNDTYLDEQAILNSELDFPFMKAEELQNLFGNPSLKSNRNYQLGFTYLDEYGRETPVFSNSEATVKVAKNHAADYTLLSSKIVSNPPSWASSFRVYVKETSNEYYNVVMDRVYRAEDGNLWLSFPSSERNKIQEDTFLILKKPADSNSLVLDDAKYKVVDIQNEVPDYLKIKSKLLSKAVGDATIPPSGIGVDYLFTSGPSFTSLDSLLSPGSKTFKINSDTFKDESAIVLTEAGVTSFDFEVGGGGSQYSRKYSIVNITLDTNDKEYTITLDKNIDSSEDWMYSDAPNAIYSSDLKLSFYKEITDVKPEFFGKFFVKIEGDGVAEQYLNTNLNEEIFYGVTSSFNVFYFSDTGKNGIVEGTTILQVSTGSVAQSGAGTGTGLDEWDQYQSNNTGINPHTGAPPVAPLTSTIHNKGDSNIGLESTDSQLDWQNILDLGILSGAALSCWFIDEAFYAGVHPTGNSNGPGNPNHVSATNGNFDYGKGIYYENGQNYIELSFSKIETSIGVNGTGITGPNSDEIDYANLNESFIWEVGSSQNPKTADQNSVTKNFTPGSKFRFVGDANSDVIYTISDSVSVRKIRRYNHTQWGEVQYRFNKWHNSNLPADLSDYEDAWKRFSAADNRRVTYVIPIDKNINNETVISGKPVTDPLKSASNTNVTNPSTIQFIEERKDEDTDIISSSNPVIFETEPLEPIDLNLFYQASDSYPTKLTIETAEQWVPLGSVVSCKSHPFVLDANQITYVTGWELNTLGALMIKFNIPLDVNGLGRLDVPDQQNLTLRFIRPDNSYTTLKGFWINPINVPFSYAGNVVFQGGASLEINNQTPYVTNTMGSPPHLWKEAAYQVHDTGLTANKIGISWFNCFAFGNGVESDRLRDVFNEKRLSKGVKVSTTIDKPYEEERRSSGLIYSGIYNSNSGVNNLNQFIQAEKITKDLNPTYGSIQKLFSRNTDLISFCEDRVIKISANKDAIFNADGNPQLIATNNVLGQTIPFTGDYGISTNPESFAKESYRAYFTDAKNGTVLRLSKDGITPISDYGMKDYFIELFKENPNSNIIGSYDERKNLFNLSVDTNPCGDVDFTPSPPFTASFVDKINGWESFKSFIPEQGVSLSGSYYTFKQGYLYKHHSLSGDRNTFYGYGDQPSEVTFLFNVAPDAVKSFHTLNYEGTQAKIIGETAGSIDSNPNRGFYNLESVEGWYCSNIETDQQDGDSLEFIEKEGKWFNYIKGKKL